MLSLWKWVSIYSNTKLWVLSCLHFSLPWLWRACNLHCLLRLMVSTKYWKDKLRVSLPLRCCCCSLNTEKWYWDDSSLQGQQDGILCRAPYVRIFSHRHWLRAGRQLHLLALCHLLFLLGIQLEHHVFIQAQSYCLFGIT